MVERKALCAARRGSQRVGSGAARGARARWRLVAPWVVLGLVVAGPWCLPSQAGSGTTGVLGVANVNQVQGAGDQPQPAGRGFASQGPTRQAP